MLHMQVINISYINRKVFLILYKNVALRLDYGTKKNVADITQS